MGEEKVIMKNLISKISCFIILVLIVISLFSLYVYSENDNLFIGQTGSPSGSTLYNSTNTFYYNGDNQFYVTSNPEDEMSMAARTYTYAFNNGEQFAMCLRCNEMVTIGAVLDNINGLLTTTNGSYILPNGIIVLVEEDYESYFNGTLEFTYHNDDLLE